MVLWCYNEHGGNMAYFLKKSTNKKGLYLQIYESFYDPARRRRHTAQSRLWAMSMSSGKPVSPTPSRTSKPR